MISRYNGSGTRWFKYTSYTMNIKHSRANIYQRQNGLTRNIVSNQREQTELLARLIEMGRHSILASISTCNLPITIKPDIFLPNMVFETKIIWKLHFSSSDRDGNAASAGSQKKVGLTRQKMKLAGNVKRNLHISAIIGPISVE